MTQQDKKRGVLPPNLDAIEVIAAQVQDGRWCVWKAVEREGGKLGKVPHQFKAGRLTPIGCNDPTQWVDFATVRNWFEVSGAGASGLGILIGSNPKDNPEVRYSSGLVAVDIDNCIGSDGALVDDLPSDVRLAVKSLQDAGVYIEVSPSGTGLRALWLGSKPDGGIREKVVRDGIGCEMYDGSTSGRYVTITGQAFEGCAAVLVDQPPAFSLDVAEWLGLLEVQKSTVNSGELGPRDLPPISDDELIKKIKQSGQGKGRKLFDGDMSEYAGDHSAADMALCRMIAQKTDDGAQVARVFGASALGKREKWQRKDYRDRTVSTALASARKAAEEGTSAAAGKSAKVQAALAAGDSGGSLASALASWGGKVPATLEGAATIIEMDTRLFAAFAFDAFSGKVVKLRSLRDCLGEIVPPDAEPKAGDGWTDADTLSLTFWLSKDWGIALKSSLVDDAISLVARRRTINLVVDALEAPRWDGRSRLNTWLVDCLQADTDYDSPRYLEAIGRAWVIGAVARAYEPGVKFDNALVLEGSQGAGKSSAAHALASAIAPHAFREGLPSLAQEQEAMMALRGVWICELSEMAFQSRSSAEHTKSFLSRLVDSFRPKYGRRDIAVPRTVAFWGTTNHGQYVQDTTGARRFWGFRVSRPIDIDALRSVAPQLWAEAVVAYKAGEKHYLTDAAVLTAAAASQAVRVERSGWDEIIEDKLIDPLTEGKLGKASEFYKQALSLWKMVAGEDAGLEFQKYARPFAEALTRCGFEKKVSGGKSMWRVGPDLLGRIHKAGL